MNLRDAIERAWFMLNSGGVPQVLSRWRREGDHMVRVMEVRVSWTPVEDPWRSSVRTPMIIESRIRQPHGWQEWRLAASERQERRRR